MSVTIDIAGLRPERLAVVPSPLAELGMALHALSEPGHHPGLQGWVTGVTARLDSHLADRMCEADFLWRTTSSDLFLPCAGIPGGSTLPGATLAEDLDLLDKLTDEQFVDAALEFTCALPYATPGPAVLADPELRRRTLELAAARGPQQLRFSRRLLEDPPHIRAWLRRFLEDCDEMFFADAWSRLRHQLAADARHKTDLLRRRGLTEALTAVSPAVSFDGPPAGSPSTSCARATPSSRTGACCSCRRAWAGPICWCCTGTAGSRCCTTRSAPPSSPRRPRSTS
jgi:hypothetical protein